MWLRYWREGVIGLLLVGLVLFGLSFQHSRQKLARAEAEAANAKVGYAQVTRDITQAKNDLVASQEALKQGIPKQMAEEIDRNRLKILAAVKADLDVRFPQGGGEGTQDKGIFTYKGDKVVESITCNAANPQRPWFTYTLKPLNLSLTGTLNFDEKEGVTKFWVNPQVVSPSPGVEVKVPKLEFTPSEEYNRWVAELRTKKTIKIPEMPKWSVEVLAGKDLTQGGGSVWGFGLRRNWSNGVSAGGGFIGKTGFLSLGYSWGNQ